ncbi:RHOMBOID-like protein 5 [Spinacia oleracea]|uniref:RHOMBOID-like protein n=1 Tax=Spinacia oleracea TaxID=3562 RepID=A0A9R0JEN4_SPIOL|nr:RHOMBOID-like protein 5 [Spinacia oleracea]
MGKRDVETGIGGTFYHYTPPPPPIYPPPREPYLSWLVPLIFVVDIALFVLTMYENNCPATLVDDPDHQCLFREHLGRFSFEPLNKNPLLGPSTATLQRMGGLRLEMVIQDGEWWRLFSCLWLHAGAIHLIANMISLLFMGIRVEEEFGFWRIGPLYVLSGLGGSLMSCLHVLHKQRVGIVSVGASGALFGLLGAMLSELITNWTIYANKCSAITSLIVVIALNLAVGLIPGVDNSAHIGGFVTGFLLGFVLLMRPQFGYVKSKYLPPGYKQKSRHKFYQYFFLLLALIALIVLYAYGFIELFKSMETRNQNSFRLLE